MLLKTQLTYLIKSRLVKQKKLNFEDSVVIILFVDKSKDL